MKDYKFGNYLTELRKANGYTQYELGKLLGVSDKAVSKWENGKAKPSTHILVNLSHILNVSLEELLMCSTNDTNNSIEFNMYGFFEDIEDRLRYKYGETLPIEIWNLYLQEKSILSKEVLVCYMLENLSKIGDKLRGLNIPFSVNVMFSGSLIMNILGLCDVNPLKPHYYCKKCKKLEFIRDVLDGWDLDDKVCSCGSNLQKDGHDIPFLTYKDTFDSIANYRVLLAKADFEKTIGIIKEHFNCLNHIACLSGINDFQEFSTDIRLGLFGVKGVIEHIKYPISLEEFYKKLYSKEKDKYVEYLNECPSVMLIENKYLNEIKRKNIDVENVDLFRKIKDFDYNKIMMNEEKTILQSKIIDVIKPNTIWQYLKCLNILYSHFDDSSYTELHIALKLNEITLEDVITCREDLFSILIKNFDYNDYNEVITLITNEIRKGRKLSKYGKLINEKINETKIVRGEINNFDKVKYLTSKSYSVFLIKVLLATLA